jgi:hypothetical protein
MSPSSATAFSQLRSHRQLGQHLLVGMGAASFWRGAWYILDDHLLPDHKPSSALVSLGLGCLGMAMSQGLVHRAETWSERVGGRVTNLITVGKKRTINSSRCALPWKKGQQRSSSVFFSSPKQRLLLTAGRIGATYTIALSCVLVWRGTWMAWDILYESLPRASALYSNLNMSSSLIDGSNHLETTNATTDAGNLTRSGLLSHLTAIGLLISVGLFASVLSPPAAASIIRDVSVRSSSRAEPLLTNVLGRRLLRRGKVFRRVKA